MSLIIDMNVCRTCMKSGGGKSIFSCADMLEQFEYTTQLDIKANDGLPTVLCERCILRMKVAYEFRRQSTISDQHLRMLIEKMNNELKKVANSTSFSATAVDDDEMKLLFGSELDLIEKPNTLEIKGEDSTELSMVIDKVEMDASEFQDEDLSENLPEADYLDDGITEEEEDDLEEADETKMATEFVDVPSDPLNPSPYTCEVCNLGFQSRAAKGRHVLSHKGHKCEMCEETFLNRVALKRHLLLHLDVRPFTCEVCNTSFTQSETLMAHLKSHTGEKKFECEICESLFQWKAELKLHMKVHMEDRPHRCDICGKGFSNVSALDMHMMIHTGEKPHKCEICGARFRQKSSLKQHNYTHTGEKPHKCTVCGRGFTQSHSLTFHMRRHTGEKPYECEQCGQTFRQKDALKNHLFTHNGIRPYSCKDCDKTFTQSSGLVAHIRRHHTLEKPYPCEKCDQCFFEVDKLNRHILIKHPEVELDNVCRICNHVSSSEGELKLHLQQRHDGADNKEPATKKSESKISSCWKCGQKFLTKTEMAQHMITKCGVKPFSCSICDKGFTQNGSLKQHMFIHTGERPYKCDVCGQGFTQSKSLKFHKRRHTGETPYVCDKCGKAFRWKDVLKRHLLRDHVDSADAYECKRCGSEFPTEGHLELHEKTHTLPVFRYTCTICQKSFLSKRGLEIHASRHKTEKEFRCDVCGKVLSRMSTLKKHRKLHQGTGETDEESVYITIKSKDEV